MSVQPHSNEPDPKPIEWTKDKSLPIIGLLAIGLLLCVVVRHSNIKPDWTTIHHIVSSVQSAVQTLALLVAGLWAYFKFNRGRAYKESLTPTVTGRFVRLDGVVYLVAMIQIENVGSSKVDFNHEVSVLILSEFTSATGAKTQAVAAEPLSSFAIFNERDRYIEPKECLSVQQFIAIPGELKPAYKLEVKIFSTPGYRWTTESIVDRSALRDNDQELLN